MGCHKARAQLSAEVADIRLMLGCDEVTAVWRLRKDQSKADVVDPRSLTEVLPCPDYVADEPLVNGVAVSAPLRVRRARDYRPVLLPSQSGVVTAKSHLRDTIARVGSMLRWLIQQRYLDNKSAR